MTAHDDEQFQDHIAALALGVLKAPETETVRSHLTACDTCRATYQDLRATTDAIGASAEIPADRMDAAQSARMKSKIFASIRSQADAKTTLPKSPSTTHPRSVIFAYALAAASLVIAFITTARDITLDAELNTTREHLTRLHERINDQARATAEQNARIADLFAADSTHYAVPGGEVVRRGDHLYLAMRSLPKLPTGHVFQAWTQTAGAATIAPSITFIPNRQGMAIVQLPVDATKIEAVTVSVEPEGGSKTPSTAPTFVKKLT